MIQFYWFINKNIQLCKNEFLKLPSMLEMPQLYTLKGKNRNYNNHYQFHSKHKNIEFSNNFSVLLHTI